MRKTTLKMKNELEKIIKELDLLCPSDKEVKKIKKYKKKLRELNRFVDEKEYLGTPKIMIEATGKYLHYYKKIEFAPNEMFDYLNMKLSNLGWKNEGYERNSKQGISFIKNVEQLKTRYQTLYCSAYISYASALLHQGNYELCITYLNKAKEQNLTIDKVNPTTKQTNILGCLHNDLGLAYRAINEIEKANFHFKKSFEILNLYKADNTFDAPKIAVLMNIGALYEKENRVEKAVKHLKSHQKYLDFFLKDNPSPYTIFHCCQYLLKISKYSHTLNDIETQKKCLNKVERLLPNVKNHYKEVAANFFFNKALLLSNQKKFRKALEINQKAFFEIFPNFTSTLISDTPKILKENFQKNQAYIIQAYSIKAELLLRFFENSSPGYSKILDICLDVVDKIGEFFRLKRKNHKGKLTKFSLGEFSKSVYEIGQKACWYLYKATSKIEYIEKAFIYANSSKALVLLEEMNQKWFNNSEQDISVAKIQSKLNNNEVLIEYSVGKNIFIYHFNKEKNIQMECLDKKESDILKLQVDHWLKHHFNIYNTTKYKEYQNEAHQIYSVLLDGIAPQINDDTTLIIAPDGFLNALPFEALVTQKNVLKCYEDIDYLIDRFTMGYTFSSYMFYLNRKKIYNNAVDNFLYVSPNFLGNKTIKEHQQIAKEQQALLQKANLTEMNYNSAPLIDYNDKTLDLSLLDDSQKILISKETLLKLISNNSEKQVPKALLYNAAIIPILKKKLDDSFSKIELLNNKCARKTKLKKYITKAKYLLISSHAEEENGILLYDENGANITFLNYETIIHLNVKTDLVVLNMCDSGRGKNVFGEGYLSLSRAFFAAGSLNVIQTLYKVSDKHSADLIAGFFTYLTKHNLSFYVALKKAKVLLRKRKGSHPKFWASHVIYGKNGKL